MDADHTTRDRSRIQIAELWRPLPWWERVVYLLTVLLLAPAFLVTELTNHLPAGWRGEVRWTLNLRLPEIDILLLIAGFPFAIATCVLVARRQSPNEWRVVQRLWSMRMIFVGVCGLYAFFVWAAWETVIELATPPNRIAVHYPPSFLVLPFWVASGLVIVGMVLALPEIIVRAARAKRRQL